MARRTSKDEDVGDDVDGEDNENDEDNEDGDVRRCVLGAEELRLHVVGRIDLSATVLHEQLEKEVKEATFLKKK